MKQSRKEAMKRALKNCVKDAEVHALHRQWLLVGVAGKGSVFFKGLAAGSLISQLYALMSIQIELCGVCGVCVYVCVGGGEWCTRVAGEPRRNTKQV